MRETESHLFLGWAKAQGVVAMVKEGPGCLSPPLFLSYSLSSAYCNEAQTRGG